MTPDTIVLAMRPHLARASPVTTPRSVRLDIRDARTPAASTATYVATLTPHEAAIARTATPLAHGSDAVTTCSTQALKDVIIAGAAWSTTNGFCVSGDLSAVDDLLDAARFQLAARPAHVPASPPLAPTPSINVPGQDRR